MMTSESCVKMLFHLEFYILLNPLILDSSREASRLPASGTQGFQVSRAELICYTEGPN